MTSLPRMQGGVTSLSQGVQECLAFNLKTPGNLELRCLPSTESAGLGGLAGGGREAAATPVSGGGLPSPGDLPNPGPPALQVDSLPSEPPG